MSDLTLGFLPLTLFVALGFIYLFWGWQEKQKVREPDWSTTKRKLAFSQIVIGGMTICTSLFLFLFWQIFPPLIIWMIVFLVSFFHYCLAFWIMDKKFALFIRMQLANTQEPSVQVRVLTYHFLAMLIGLVILFSFIEICRNFGPPLNYLTNDAGRLVLLLLLGFVTELFLTLLLFLSLISKASQTRNRADRR